MTCTLPKICINELTDLQRELGSQLTSCRFEVAALHALQALGHPMFQFFVGAYPMTGHLNMPT